MASDITLASRRMTYVELAEVRGISAESAERLVRRRKWLRHIGNDGVVHVVVPATEARPAKRPRADVSDGQSGQTSADITSVIREVIREVVSPLSAQLIHERAERRELQAKLDHLMTRGWWARLRNKR